MAATIHFQVRCAAMPMARYGTLRTWATRLGYADAAKLLEATLLEERATDQALSKLAEAGGDNAKAA